MAVDDIASLDFESRSKVNLKTEGAWRYSRCPSTEVLTASFRLPGMAAVVHSHRGPYLNAPWSNADQLQALLDHVRRGGKIRGWNVMFEFLIWNHVCVPKYGWPELKLEQLVDTMACAAAHNLPQSLEKCGEALGISEEKLKSKRGKYLIQRLCCEQKATKKQPARFVEDAELFGELVGYCDQDVVAEETIAKKLRPLTDYQQRAWILTQRINLRGVPLARLETVRFVQVIETEKERLNRELRALTGRAVTAATKRDDLLRWCNNQMPKPDLALFEPEEDEELDPLAAALLRIEQWGAANVPAIGDLKKKTVEQVLQRDDLPAGVRRALEIRAAVTQTSTAKFAKMLKVVADDDTLKNMYVWHGAGTGRWASRGGINCFTGDVEVLTPGGWRRFDAWHGEPVMQWWPDGRLSFCRTPVPVVKEYAGPVVDVDAPLVSATMTPEHRLVFWREGKYRETIAGSLLNYAESTGLGGVPIGGVWDGAVVSRFTPDEARFLVALAADGSVYPRKTQRPTVVLGFRKERKIRRMRDLLVRLGLPFSEAQYPPQSGHRGDQATVRFTISDCPYDKGFGPWLLDLDRAALDAVVDELPHWDGWRHSKTGVTEFSTADRKQAEWVSLALHLSGSGGSVREYSCASRRGSRFQVHAREPGSYTTIPRPTVSEQRHEGLVYCVSVESTYILIRRNSKISVSGQCQNFARPVFGDRDIEAAFSLVGSGPAAGLTPHARFHLMFGDDTMDAAKSCLRGVLAAPEGYDLIDADYSSIENRMAAFIAGQWDKLELFAKGLDEYKTFASTTLFKVPYEAVTKDQRQFTKPVILGGIFGLGAKGLVAYAEQYGVSMSLEEAEAAVKGFRQAYRQVRDCWYDCGDASIAAVRNPGMWIEINERLSMICHRNFLWLKLPSGRLICWSRPKIEMKQAPWMEKFWIGYDADGQDVYGERPAWKEVVTVESIDTKTRIYKRHPLIGSSIFQSSVQGAAADVLTEGTFHTEEVGYSTVMLTHDENTALVPEGWGDPDEFGQLLCTPKPWRRELPLSYEAYRAKRFRK